MLFMMMTLIRRNVYSKSRGVQNAKRANFIVYINVRANEVSESIIVFCFQMSEALTDQVSSLCVPQLKFSHCKYLTLFEFPANLFLGRDFGNKSHPLELMNLALLRGT